MRVTQTLLYTKNRLEERAEQMQSSKRVGKKTTEPENHVENEWTRPKTTTQKTGGSGKHF